MHLESAVSPLVRWSERVGPRRLAVVVWFAIGTAAVAQRWLDRSLAGEVYDLRAAAIDVWLIALWAGASPWIVATARRYPVRGDRVIRHGAMHLAGAIAFIVLTNVLVRLPLLWPLRFSFFSAAADLGMGLVRFGPMALLVYAAIAAVGHLLPSDGKAAYPERITVREWSRAHLVRAADVEWVESDDNYVIVQVAGRVIKGRGRISDLESRLDPAHFVRIHRSAIVARDRVREVRPLAKGDVAVVMMDGKVLRVARTRRGALERVLVRTPDFGLRTPD